MKTFIVFALLLFAATAFGQAEKTVHNIFKSDATEVVLDFGKNVEVEVLETKSSRILVETTVQIDGLGSAGLNYFVAAGRYEVQMTESGEEISLILQKNSDVLMKNGEKLDETVSVRVYLPEHIKFVQNPDHQIASK